MMRRLATSLIFLVACTAAQAAPMTFQEADNGANCAECEWIAADGEITPDTPDQFSNFLKNSGRAHLFINSPGGDLVAGVMLGGLFRKNHMMVAVHRTVKSGRDGFDDVAKGTCVSACSYAFLGGETRNADSREIGIHQFSVGASDYPGSRDPISTVQTATAYLIEYVVKMGVDPHFLSLASSTRDVYYLEKADLDLYKVRWQPKEFLPWGIRVSGGGITALSQTRDGSLTASVFCRADRVPRLQLTGLADAKELREAMADVFRITAFGMPVAKSAVGFTTTNGKSIMDIRLDKLNPASLRPNVKVFDADVAHVVSDYFDYKITSDGAVVNVAAALKNCI